jgi:hypothetical protein
MGERCGPYQCTSRWRAIAFDEVGSDFFLRLVVPHLCFGEQAPALKGMKYSTLAAQGFHCTVANEVVHFSSPTSLPRII